MRLLIAIKELASRPDCLEHLARTIPAGFGGLQDLATVVQALRTRADALTAHMTEGMLVWSPSAVGSLSLVASGIAN